MANPRKFSEKIALHNQKQAEGTAAFEEVMRDVVESTRGSFQKQNQHLRIQQNIMNQYRGGSLPNVNQMATATNNTGIDLQTALQHLEGMRGGVQNRGERMHPRDRGRPQIGPLRRPFQMDKSRTDCSPYGSAAYLSPPPETSWRRLFRHLNGANLSRTNSDSAIHTSTMSGVSDVHSPNTPPLHRRIQEVVGENSIPGDLKNTYPWDPKKLQQRPKSCEVPNINIYPSSEQESQLHVPVSNNTGSLPDLTILQFPSPLTTPIDVEDQAFGQVSPTNLSPTSAHHMTMGPPQHPSQGSPAQSPGSQRRRPNQGGPSPLVLQGSSSPQSMRLPHSPPVSNVDPSRLQMDPRIRQQYMLYMQQQQQRHRVQGSSSTQPSEHNNLGQQRVPPPHRGPVPKVCVTSHENDSEPSMTQYRNSETGCQSPTSPHSQPSYSPAQSPGLPQPSWNNSAFDMDPYHVQQQQQTNALQHQFEHFNMRHDNQGSSAETTIVVSSNGSSTAIYTAPLSSLNFTQAATHNLTGSQEFQQQQQPQQQQQQQQQQQFYSPVEVNSSQSHLMNMLQQGQQQQANSKIPDIVLTGTEWGSDDTLNKQDFAKELGNAITGMSDGCFDADFFGSVSDEALKDGLVPLDLDGLQMLTDPTMVADPDTENSFRMDHL